MDKCIENCVEFLTKQEVCTATFSSKRFINKIKRLSSKFPDVFSVDTENADGSIVAHFPVSLLSIRSPKRKKEV